MLTALPFEQQKIITICRLIKIKIKVPSAAVSGEDPLPQRGFLLALSSHSLKAALWGLPGGL
jgi:hypothetical protein